jgi:hypothetical protein
MEWPTMISHPILIVVSSGLLVCVFLRGASHKLLDFGWFVHTLAEYRLLPAALAPAAAGVLALAETAVAIGLVAPQSRGAAAMAGCVLLLVYGGAVAVNLLRGRSRIECGCGGAGEGLSWVLVARNAVLAGLALIASQAPLQAAFGPFEWMTGAAAIASMWLLLVSIEKLAANLSWLTAADTARDQHPARH